MATKLVICIKNDGYEISLDRRKIYKVIEDEQSENLNQIRVVDESGEDYLYPSEFFIMIDLPVPLQEAVLAA